MKTITTFEGQVNDRKFNNKDEMLKYVQECISNGIDIWNMCSSSSVRTVCDQKDTECDQKCDQKCIKCDQKCDQEEIQPIESWPADYSEFADYMIPFVNEDIKADPQMVDDTENKLTLRTKYYVRNFAGCNAATFNRWFDKDFMSKLDGKLAWCSKRKEEIDSQIANTKMRIDRLQVEINQLEKQNDKYNVLSDIYDEVGGYCAAMLDEITSDTRYKE